MLLSSGITSPKFASATFNATQNNNNNFGYGQKTLRAKLLEFFEQHAPAKTATVPSRSLPEGCVEWLDRSFTFFLSKTVFTWRRWQ